MEIQMQSKPMAATTTSIASEMLGLALHALVSGVAAAIVAGSLVVVLTVIAA
jgi:membrane protein implicated in regulation of membrane protease activity